MKCNKKLQSFWWIVTGSCKLAVIEYSSHSFAFFCIGLTCSIFNYIKKLNLWTSNNSDHIPLDFKKQNQHYGWLYKWKKNASIKIGFYNNKSFQVGYEMCGVQVRWSYNIESIFFNVEFIIVFYVEFIKQKCFNFIRYCAPNFNPLIFKTFMQFVCSISK